VEHNTTKLWHDVDRECYTSYNCAGHWILLLFFSSAFRIDSASFSELWCCTSELLLIWVEDFYFKPVWGKLTVMVDTSSWIRVNWLYIWVQLFLNVVGTEKWVQNLTWPGLPKFNKSWRTALYVANTRQVAGYVKSYKNFSFYWILDAGHMVFSVICWLIFYGR